MIEMRWATRAECLAVMGDVQFPTYRAFGLFIGEIPMAIAALRYDVAEPRMIVSVDMMPEARKWPLTLHRWGKKAIEVAQNLGVKSFVVIADRAIPRSEAWLTRLGLRCVGEVPQGAIYEWQAERSADPLRQRAPS